MAKGLNGSHAEPPPIIVEDTPALNAKDYPAVTFWYKKQRRNSTEPFSFLQRSDGSNVDNDVLTSVRADAKLIWTAMSEDYGPMGLPWTSVLAKRRLDFWLRLERVHPFLRLCANHYKADAITTSDYTHWYNAHIHKRQRPVTPVTTRKVRRTSSLSRRSRRRIEDDEDEDDDIVENDVDVGEENVDNEENDEGNSEESEHDVVLLDSDDVVETCRDDSNKGKKKKKDDSPSPSRNDATVRIYPTLIVICTNGFGTKRKPLTRLMLRERNGCLYKVPLSPWICIRS